MGIRFQHWYDGDDHQSNEDNWLDDYRKAEVEREVVVFEWNAELDMSERSTHVNLNNASVRRSCPRVSKKQRTNGKVSERLKVPSEEKELENEYYLWWRKQWRDISKTSRPLKSKTMLRVRLNATNENVLNQL